MAASVWGHPMCKIALIILSLIISLEAFSQTATLQTQAPSRTTNWSGFASMGYSSNLYEKSETAAQAFGTASLLLNYRVSGDNLIRGSISGYQEQNQGQESKLNDGYVGWVNNGFWKKGKVLTIGQQIRGVFPSSKNSYRRDEKILGVTVVPSFMFNLTPVGLRGVILIYQPQFNKNAHRLQQNRAYQNNTSYNVNQSLALVWSITDHVYVQSAFVYGMGWSYGGVKRPDSYQVLSEVGYSFNAGLTLSAGVTNAGAIRNFENGNDQTIELFNNKTASVYTDLTYVF